MSDEPDSKPKPSTQQEVNLAVMECIRHLAQYTVEVSKLAGAGAGVAAANAKAAGDEEGYERIMAQGEIARKAGLHYHNAAMDLWDAFQRDAGDDLVRPRETKRVPIDD
ncbi:hypothetical protein [Pseudomonas helleri]|uniref:hypothetical protein n=1 Tax=Pseudomonas helleri TaxID=1608996 RepID=UPI003F98326B